MQSCLHEVVAANLASCFNRIGLRTTIDLRPIRILHRTPPSANYDALR